MVGQPLSGDYQNPVSSVKTKKKLTMLSEQTQFPHQKVFQENIFLNLMDMFFKSPEQK